MASGDDSTDTFMQEDDSLENLRARATCSVCKEFYTKPKRLDKCSHVFCLNCIKLHLQAIRHVNFPGCPMCRKPISKPLSEINDLEPGRAEEDIVNFVKKYETCGLCDKKENPKLVCSECKCFVCENCKLCHSKLKPTHVVEFLLHSASHSRLNTKQMCRQHPQLVLDLFCIICQKMLCSYCEKFSHGECQNPYTDRLVEMRCRSGYLHEYVKKLPLVHRNCLPRIFYITDFVKGVKLWLDEVKLELEECLHFYKNYRLEMTGTINDIEESKYIHSMNEKMNKIHKEGETIYASIIKLLENATDFEVAKSVLLIEHRVLQFFQLRQKHNIKIKPLKLAVDKGVICKQVSANILQQHDGDFAGIFCIPYNDRLTNLYHEYLKVKQEFAKAGIISAVNETSSESLHIPIWHDIICIYETTDTDVAPVLVSNDLVGILDCNKRISNNFTANYRTEYHDNNVYTNVFIEKATKEILSRTLNVKTTDIGYTDAFTEGTYYFRRLRPDFFIGMNEIENPYIIVVLRSDLNVAIATCFINILVVPSLFDVNGGYPKIYRPEESCLLCFIGNSDSTAGLVTTFIYFGTSALNTYGTCFRTKIAKFNNCSPSNLECVRNFKSIKNKSRSFSFSSIHEENLFRASYRSITTETSVPKNYLRHFNFTEQSERVIPVTFENVSLLCSIKKGLFFAKYNDELDELAIGKLSFSSERMETDVIISLKGADVGTPVSKLKPLTMVGNRENDIVVVCAVEDDKFDTLVMIWPYKEASNRVEVLEVQYPATVLSNATVVDLEMDPDGNIMYVLENQKGESQSVCTKYFMPK